MKRKRHTPEQISGKLREADPMLRAGEAVARVVQHLGVSEQTYHRWRNPYDGMKASEAKRLTELEQEKVRLKKAVGSPNRDGMRVGARGGSDAG
jgi:putative transposase